MRYAIALLLLAGCASTENADIRMVTAEEKACSAKATQFVKDRWPEAELDSNGVPYVNLMGGHYLQWAMVADRCLKASGVY